MFDLTSAHPGSSLRSQGEAWVRRHTPARRYQSPDVLPKALVVGLVVAGLGYLAWSYLGPDLKRYMKIQSM